MCREFCKVTPIGFSNITRDSFNQYEKAMEYIQNQHSSENGEEMLKYKLTKFLSSSLNICPKIMTEMVLESIRKANEATNVHNLITK